MNLQLVSPYKKCPFRCPFCVAAVNEESPYSDELYLTDPDTYLYNLKETIQKNDITTVVITGDTEPTLFPLWLERVLLILTKENVNIEIQTRNYKFKGDARYDVVAYSFDEVPEETFYSNGKQTRAVFINNLNLDLEDVYFYKLLTQQQITIKQMQLSAYGIKEIDKYITEHYWHLDENDIKDIKRHGVYYDPDCMNSKDRYIIYRCDGEVYKTWDEPPKNKIEK